MTKLTKTMQQKTKKPILQSIKCIFFWQSTGYEYILHDDQKAMGNKHNRL